MKSERRGSANNSGCGFVLVALGVAVFAAKGGYDTGWNVGVRAHAKGEAVVVSLPDGTDTVVKVKKESKP